MIATYGEQVVDTFYVKDMFGLKFHSETRRKTLEKKLREAIERGAERARDLMASVRLVRGFLTVGGWTMACRLLGFVRDIVIAASLGAGPVAEAFLIAFSLPNMFRRFFAEGAFNMAFVPMFSKKVEAGDGAHEFARDAFTGLATILIVFTAGRAGVHAGAGAGDGLGLSRRRTLRPRGALRADRLSLHPVHLAGGAALGRAERDRAASPPPPPRRCC